MLKVHTLAVAIVFSAAPSFCQPAPPAFEAASVKQSAPHEAGQPVVRMGSDPSGVDYHDATLLDVLARAYGIKANLIQGPDWLDSERYDIVAKVPAGVPPSEVPRMLQALLRDRFAMTVRKETKEESVYGLVQDKGGSKLKPAKDGDSEISVAGGGRIAGRKGGMTVLGGPNGPRLTAKGATLPAFAEMLGRFLDRPVVDMTGIAGEFDIEMDVAVEDLAALRGGTVILPPGAPPLPHGTGASIFTGVQELGLKLEPKNGSVERLVVEKANKVPTAN